MTADTVQSIKGCLISLAQHHAASPVWIIQLAKSVEDAELRVVQELHVYLTSRNV